MLNIQHQVSATWAQGISNFTTDVLNAIESRFLRHFYQFFSPNYPGFSSQTTVLKVSLAWVLVWESSSLFYYLQIPRYSTSWWGNMKESILLFSMFALKDGSLLSHRNYACRRYIPYHPIFQLIINFVNFGTRLIFYYSKLPSLKVLEPPRRSNMFCWQSFQPIILMQFFGTISGKLFTFR